MTEGQFKEIFKLEAGKQFKMTKCVEYYSY